MKNIFKYWNNLKKEFINKHIVLFLDYDGTLAPIVEIPKKAAIPNKTKKVLQKLSNSKKFKIAIISGRALEDIKNRVGIRNIIYSGNHGLEIEGPKIRFKTPISSRYLTTLEKIKNDLKDKLYSINGAFVEDKGLSLSLHYRLVDKESISKVKTIFHETIIFYLVENKIKIKRGKMVLEVRPPLEWDKGKVVLWLLARQRFVLRNEDILPIYIGDDISDEDAFKALRNKGVTIFVGKPRKSYAQYYLKNTKEVKEFLKKLIQLLKSE